MQTKILSLITPLHVHDCDKCKFMGAVKFGRGKTAILGDVYICEDSEEVTLRWGKDGDYTARPAQNGYAEGDDLWGAVLSIVDMGRKPAKWTPELVRERLARYDVSVVKAVSAIYAHQTDAEKHTHVTKEDNGVGFNGVDAELLSSFAEFIERNGTLTQGQMVYARRKILKYAGQLAKIANGTV